jgi:bifunctional DNase/RNase
VPHPTSLAVAGAVPRAAGARGGRRGSPAGPFAPPPHRWLALALAVAALGAGACGGGCASPGRQPAGAAAPGDETAAATPPAPPAPTVAVDGDYLPAEIATIGWDALAQSPIVLLRDVSSGRVVPIWVGLAEAQSIAAALHEVEFPRPMTHDLMANLLTRLDARMEELLIHALIDNTYFALIRLRVPGRDQPLLIDTRPSDGMALALRTGASIRMARRIVEDSPDFEFLAPEGEEQVVRALGLTLVAPTDELRERFGLPDRPGLVVTRAVGEAEAKGLRRGDLIVSAGGRVPEVPVAFLDVLREAPADRPLAIVYWRDGDEHTAELDPTADEAAPKAPPRVV